MQKAGAQGCKGARLQGDSLTILAPPGWGARVQGCKIARRLFNHSCTPGWGARVQGCKIAGKLFDHSCTPGWVTTLALPLGCKND